MTEYRYLHLDVFTDEALAGNQLAVFPEPAGLDDVTMQRIANEMAFSETTFVWPRASEGTGVRVRIFTPGRELPMACHPTVGTAFALAELGIIAPGAMSTVFGLGVGPTQVDLEWDGARLTAAWMNQRAPEFGAADWDSAAVARMVGVPADEITATGLPIVSGSAGVEFLYVPVATRLAVDRAAMDLALARQVYANHGGTELAVYLFTTEPGDDSATAYCRMFGSVLGVTEDPATGGAAGPMAGYLVSYGKARAGVEIVLRQGVAMGRPSTIRAVVEGEEAITGVRVGGAAVVVGEGVVRLESASA